MIFTFEDCQKATVRIYRSDSDEICGAGFLIHAQYVLTCAHVVNEALGLDINSYDLPAEKVTLDFLQVTQTKKLKSTVIIWKSPSEYSYKTSDIALLQLDYPVNILPIPLIPKTQKSVSDDRFKVWGFPTSYDGGLATEGKIVTEEQLRIDDNMPRIIGGFSGAPVWDTSLHRVVGMVVETDTVDQTKVDSYGTSYISDGFDGRTVFIRKLSILQSLCLKQGMLIELGREYKLWENYQDVLLEAYYSLPHSLLDNAPDSLEILIDRISNSKDNLLHWVIYFLIHARYKQELKQSLIRYLKSLYEDDEIQQKYNDLKPKFTKGETEKKESQIESRLWIFLAVLDNPDQLQLSSAYLMKGCDLDSLEQLNLEFTGRFDRENIAEEISPFLKEIMSQSQKYGKCLIEIFLPYECLDLNPDAWMLKDKYGEFTLGSRYPVVIRVLDRVIDEDEYTSEWKGKWNSDKLAILCQQGLWCCDRPTNELDKALDNGKAVGLRIQSPPQSHKNDPLPMIMRKGVAIAFWLRQKLEDCEAKEEYQRILERTRLQDLPQELKSMRTADPKNSEHLARHLTLLWDDPTVAPPSGFDFSFIDNAHKL
jgi:hypothetical protein